MPDSSQTTIDKLRETSLRVLNAVIELVAHLNVLTVLLLGIWLLERLVHWLWGSTDFLFFGWLKLKYLFDGADLILLVGFLLWGVYSAIVAYVKKPE